MQSVIDAVKNNSINGEIAIVISNRKNAYGLERARQAGIETAVVRKDDELIVKMLKERNVGLVVLAGYLAILTDVLIDAYPNKIINIPTPMSPIHTAPINIEIIATNTVGSKVSPIVVLNIFSNG